MNIEEAYKLLEVQETVSDDDLKKKWKSLAKKYHPDVNKDHPDKLKQINEAYQFIKNQRENPTPVHSFDISDIFGGFRQQHGQQRRNVEHISLKQEVSFVESVLGTEKEIEVDRDTKCAECNGQGFKLKKNSCTHCNGYGQTTVQRGNISFNTNCTQCRGQGTKDACTPCDKKGFLRKKTKMKVKIPPGVSDDNVIQLHGAGHYAGGSMFGDAYSNILMEIAVKNDTQLKLQGMDVIYHLNISLLEALEGCSKTVPSIKGEQTVEVMAGSKNKEEIMLKNFGVNLEGDERIILDVSYPEDKQKLIQALKE